MIIEKRKKKCMRKNYEKIHKIINALKTFFDFLQLLKAIVEFFH